MADRMPANCGTSIHATDLVGTRRAGPSMGFSHRRRHTAVEAPRCALALLTKLGYSAGFLLVILGRQQLFTENTLTPMLPLFSKPERSTMLNVARLWIVVLLANLVGALLIVRILAATP